MIDLVRGFVDPLVSGDFVRFVQEWDLRMRATARRVMESRGRFMTGSGPAAGRGLSGRCEAGRKVAHGSSDGKSRASLKWWRRSGGF